MSRSKKGFTIVELVIVIAVIAILAAVLIPSFSSLNKKAKDSAYLQERTNQQIADLAEKVENQDFLSWEDLEAKLAEELAKIETGVTDDEMKTAVTAAVTTALAEHLRADTNNNTALTEAQVQAIIEKALEGQLTTAQVEAIVNAAVDSIAIPEVKETVTTDQIKAIIDNAVAGLDKQTGITADEMKDAITAAMKEQTTLSDTDVETIINNALNGFGYGNDISSGQIKDIIDAAMGNIDVTADQLAVNEMNAILANVQSVKNLIVAGNDAQTSINIFNTLIANGYNDEIDAYHQGHGFGYVVDNNKAVIVLVEADKATYPTEYANQAYKLFFEAVDNAEELESAFETGYVLLKKDATFDNSISISNDLTLVSNSKILSDTDISFDSAANSIVNVTGANEEITVNMSGVTLAKERQQAYNRGLSIGNNNKKVTIVLDNVNIDAYYYAINIAASNYEGVELVVKNSTITGWAALNVWSKSNITFENCTIIGNDASTNNHFATITLNDGFSNGYECSAEDSVLTFKNCTIEANTAKNNPNMKMVDIRCNATLTFEGCTFKVNGNTVSELTKSGNTDTYATITVR